VDCRRFCGRRRGCGATGARGRTGRRDCASVDAHQARQDTLSSGTGVVGDNGRNGCRVGGVKVSARSEIVVWNLIGSNVRIGPIRERGELFEDIVIWRGSIPSSLNNYYTLLKQDTKLYRPQLA